MEVSHIIQMGHRNIACIQGINGISANSDRVRGYKDALKGNGIKVKQKLILGTDFGKENGYVQAKALLKSKEIPTAFFALSNLISLVMLRAFKETGLNVPHDVSIVSFDEQPYSAFLACPMTTVEQPREEIGKLAFQYLLNRINDGNEGKIENTMLKPRLIIRESVKKLNKN